MSSIIYDRLKKYSATTQEEENYVLKEILQEIILYALSESGFFKEALFQGGTSLRVFYNLGRFSEDLDFILKTPNPNFRWRPFLKAIEDTCIQYGLSPEVVDKNKAGNVQEMILKDNSIVKLLKLSFQDNSEKKLRIKLEIDINPPLGSSAETKFLDFPMPCKVEVQDLPSNFAGKSHALLCRKYTKGRDWYDFLWYVSKEISPNFILLSEAINQQGPWAGKNIPITPDWYLSELKNKINQIDWQKAASDVAPFLKEQERNTLKLWGKHFFMDRVEKLENTLNDNFQDINNIHLDVACPLNKIEKALITDFLLYIKHYLVNAGYKLDNTIKLLSTSLKDIEARLFITKKETPYRIRMPNRLFVDQNLKEALLKAKTQKTCKTLLETQYIKVEPKNFFEII